MEFDKVIEKRKAIRKFKDKSIELEKIREILKSARLAPSGLNKQPWEFIVVTDKGKIKKLREIYDDVRKNLDLYKQNTSFIENTIPIIVCTTGDKISTSLAVENMLLKATDLGLGSLPATCFMGTDDAKNKIRDLLNIPDLVEPMIAVLIGYADESPQRKPRDKKTHWDGW